MSMHRGAGTLVLVACAWVLWSYETPGRWHHELPPGQQSYGLPDQWKPVGPFPTEATCESGVQGALLWWKEAFATKDIRGRIEGGRVYIEQPGTDVVKIIRPQCWPDTVDPRPR
jgi:hypothetical protein